MKRFFLLASLISTSLFSQTVPNYVPTNGLVGWWPFNGNANDLSGNGNNGTVNGATLTADRFGNINCAYDFDGIDDYISGNSNNLNVQSTNKLTLASWVKVNQFANSPAASKIITHTNASNSGQQYALSIRNDGSLYFLAGNGDFEDNGPNISPASLIQNNTWAHVAAVISDDSVKLYVNNNLVLNKPENDIFPSNPIGTFVFSSLVNTTYNKLFNGVIDDIGIWNRALTPAEIQTLYFGCADTLAQNPTSATATVGTNATFTALSSASGATYQWQAKNGSNFVNVSNAGQFSGATSSTLTVNSVTSANNGLQVRCIVDHGDCVDTSAVAVLTACFAITSQPANQFVVPSNSATFALSTNDPACTYQWQTNAGFGFQNLSNAGQFSGVTSAALSVSGVSQANNNQIFRCLVSAGNCLDTTVSAKIVLSGVGVSENALMRVSVSPTPTRGSVDLGVALEGTYTLIGIDGRAVQTGSIRQVLDFSQQPAGVYSLRLETAAGSRVLKVVKE